MEIPFDTLIHTAISAPSGDNIQPWRFVVDRELRRIALYVDESRDTSPMNGGQRMSRLAVGAALENLLLAAKGLGCETDEEEPSDHAVAVVRFSRCHGKSGHVDPAISARVTNRRHYDGRIIRAKVLVELDRQVQNCHGTRTIWVNDRRSIDSLASLIGRTDAAMFNEPAMRKAFLDNVRFDVPWNAEVEEGLSLGCLELTLPQRVALRFLRRIPSRLFRIAGLRQQFARAAQKLVRSASGICVICGGNSGLTTEIAAGRTLQRVWLALTRQGLAVQPMMSLAIFENTVYAEPTEALARIGNDRAASMAQEFRQLVPQIEDDRVAFIMRYGFAPPPTLRTARLSLSACTQVLPIPQPCVSVL